MNAKHAFALLTLAFTALSCAHRPVLPDTKEVVTRREAPSKDCREIGPISGTSLSPKATAEQVLEDLKKEATNKGANYVQIKQYSDNHTAVTGIAFECP